MLHKKGNTKCASKPFTNSIIFSLWDRANVVVQVYTAAAIKRSFERQSADTDLDEYAPILKHRCHECTMLSSIRLFQCIFLCNKRAHFINVRSLACTCFCSICCVLQPASICRHQTDGLIRSIQWSDLSPGQIFRPSQAWSDDGLHSVGRNRIQIHLDQMDYLSC